MADVEMTASEKLIAYKYPELKPCQAKMVARFLDGVYALPRMGWESKSKHWVWLKCDEQCIAMPMRIVGQESIGYLARDFWVVIDSVLQMCREKCERMRGKEDGNEQNGNGGS